MMLGVALSLRRKQEETFCFQRSYKSYSRKGSDMENHTGYKWWRLCVWSLMVSAILGINFISLNSTLAESTYYTSKQHAKYIFYFIGDGMGFAQREAAEQFARKKLVMNTFPAQGITTTYSANRLVTDSAAAVTTMASGSKTNNGMIGITPDKRRPKSVAELAKEKQMKVGIISSVPIDHATPAGFYAHVPSRKMYYDIELSLADSGFDFFGGGGLIDPTNKRSRSKNFKGDAVLYIKSKNYKVVTTREEFTKLSKDDGKVIAWNPILPDGNALPYRFDVEKTPELASKTITLAEFTAKAIEMLDNEKGFFLMVEGGKIDWACHANDAATAISDTLGFDKSIEEAVEFWRKHPNETLIVVTADHECGGLNLDFGGAGCKTSFELLDKQKMSFKKFTDTVLKPFKIECRSRSQCKFDDIKPLITKYFGLKFEGDTSEKLVLKEFEKRRLEYAFHVSINRNKVIPFNPKTDLAYGYRNDPLTATIIRMLNSKAGLIWTTFDHTGIPVCTSAKGVGEEIFKGNYDNTDLAKKIMSVMGITPKVYYQDKIEPKVAVK